jgi:tRNA threonylcarbamoyladenosine biosynthesis protein TsaB
MKILCLDTSSRYLCLGLVNGPRIFEYRIDTGVALSRVLVPTIERVLAAAGMSPADIDHYALGLGPGSFTALRIGFAAFKAMAWANRAPIVGVPTLEILAAHPRVPAGIIAVVSDAKRSLFYCGWYNKTDGGIHPIASEELFDQSAFISRTKKIKSAHKGKRIIMMGDGLPLCSAGAREVFPEVILLERDLWYPQPQPLIELSQRQITVGKTSNPFEIEPIYLYAHDCQVRKARG